MAGLKNYCALGVIFSQMPGSEVKDLLFKEGIYPSNVYGVYINGIRSVLTLEYSLHKNRQSISYQARWDTQTGKIECYSRKEKKKRVLHVTAWKVNLLTNIQMGWTLRTGHRNSYILGSRSRQNTRGFITLEDNLRAFLESLA